MWEIKLADDLHFSTVRAACQHVVWRGKLQSTQQCSRTHIRHNNVPTVKHTHIVDEMSPHYGTDRHNTECVVLSPATCVANTQLCSGCQQGQLQPVGHWCRLAYIGMHFTDITDSLCFSSFAIMSLRTFVKQHLTINKCAHFPTCLHLFRLQLHWPPSSNMNWRCIPIRMELRRSRSRLSPLYCLSWYYRLW